MATSPLVTLYNDTIEGIVMIRAQVVPPRLDSADGFTALARAS